MISLVLVDEKYFSYPKTAAQKTLTLEILVLNDERK